MFRKSIVSLLAATALAAGVVPAGAADHFVFRYQGKGPKLAAAPAAPAGTIGGTVTITEDMIGPFNAAFSPSAGWNWQGNATILGLSDEFAFSHGTKSAGGAWSVPVADLAAGTVTITPPANYSGVLPLNVTATLSNGSGGTEGVSGTVNLDVRPYPDVPVIHASNVTGTVNDPITLDLGISLVDTDGSEHLADARISGLPSGATLSHGTREDDGTWVVGPDDLPLLVLTMPPGWTGSAWVSLQGDAVESATGNHSGANRWFQVTVN